MQEFISKKRVVKITEHWNSKYHYTTNDWIWIPQGCVVIAKNKLENPDWNMTIPTVTTIPEETKLVFHSTSKFPRHKLGLTTYKRKIKEKGADYMVGNFTTVLVNDCTKYEHAYETNDTIFVTYCKTFNIDWFAADCKVDLSNAIHYTNYELINADKEKLFYLDYIQGKYSLPIISDRALNALVDKKLDRLTIDELSTVIEMVKSQDRENVNLALKLFAQFNLSADPLMSWFFLSAYARYFSGINSVLYTNLKEQFKPNKHLWYGSLLSTLKNVLPKDDHERDLVDRILADYIIVDRLSVNTVLEFKNLGYKIEINGW